MRPLEVHLAYLEVFWQQIKIKFQLINLIKTYKQINSILLTLIFHIDSQQKPHLMKLSSPFLQQIPDCKRKMRRLRKKIYKYLNSKTNTKSTHKNKGLHLTLQQSNLPVFLQQLLSRKKVVDMHTIKSINVNAKISLEEMVNLVNKQEANIKDKYSKWKVEEQEKQKMKYQSRYENLYARQLLSKRTISSTEQSDFGIQNYKDESQSPNMYESFYNQLNNSPTQNPEFNPFMVESIFLSMESSVLSYQNLFK